MIVIMFISGGYIVIIIISSSIIIDVNSLVIAVNIRPIDVIRMHVFSLVLFPFFAQYMSIRGTDIVSVSRFEFANGVEL